MGKKSKEENEKGREGEEKIIKGWRGRVDTRRWRENGGAGGR